MNLNDTPTRGHLSEAEFDELLAGQFGPVRYTAQQHYGHGALHDLQHSDAPSYFPGGQPIAGEECADVEPGKRPMSRADGRGAIAALIVAGVCSLLAIAWLWHVVAGWLA